jgi:hypothetical protein
MIILRLQKAAGVFALLFPRHTMLISAMVLKHLITRFSKMHTLAADSMTCEALPGYLY